MKRLLWIAISLPFLLVQAKATEPPAERIFDGLVREGIRATILQNYTRAYAIFDSLRALSPDDPRPYFYKAAALQSEMMDLEDYTQEREFLRLIDETIRRAAKWIDHHPDRPEGYFFKGGALSYRGFYFAQRKNYLRGIRDAVVGIRYLNKAIRADSTYYDAYLGIGTYKYWRSRLTEFLSWLPFFPDQKKEGLALIRLAAKRGRYGRDVALNGLMWIRLDQKDYGEAIAIGERMMAKYPGSRFFLWPLAEAYYRAGKFGMALKSYRQLMESYRAQPRNNHYNEILCGLRVVQSYLHQGELSTACRTARELLKIDLQKKIRKRLEEKLKKLEEIAALCPPTRTETTLKRQ